ncbi:MAG: membrane protein insertase YidC [Gammaproteobacteria bacterium]|nr:MAG: membrane protein insertase YidC [Gammaproteobacteria bacterium]
MTNQRTILWALFAAMAFLTWSKWQVEQAPAVDPGQATAAANEVESQLPAFADADNSARINELPVMSDPSSAQPTAAIPGVKPELATVEQFISVRSDVLDLRISKTGGTLVGAALRKYPKHKDEPDVVVELLRGDREDPYVLISGLVDSSRGGPTHLATFETDSDTFVMQPSADVLEVPLYWTSNGITVEKIYRLKRGSYAINIEYRVLNESADDWRVLSYLQIRRFHSPPERSMFDVDTYSFNGPVIYDGEKYEKLDPEDFADDPVNRKLAGGWIASIEHHFLSAAVPPADEEFSYDANYDAGIATVRANGPTRVVAPGEQKLFKADFFVGPKLQDQLEETAPGLALTADYGLLAIVAQPLFWILQKVYGLFGNWGWTIIFVTFLIKATFYKLTEASGRSMAKMRKLQPRLKSLQERYKDDRQALSQHMMELYKTEKVNPAAGCLPMIIQIPFFIAFYWVLLESVEMRQAPFALWITDLSSRDPYFILPLLMGLAMFVQQKLNPAPPDPIQAKVMMMLPIMFTGFFAFFPSGLVLYWLTNSVLSVIQQWNINRKMAVD